MFTLFLRQLGLWLYNTAQTAWSAQVRARKSVGMGVEGIIPPDKPDTALFVVRLTQSPVESITITDAHDIPMDGLVHFDDQVVGTLADCLGSPRYCPLTGPGALRIAGKFPEGAKPFLNLHIVLRV